jgi:flagellar biogenesis protein FliO
MSVSRKTNRNSKKNVKPPSISHRALGLFAAMLLHRCSKRLSTVWQNLRRRLRSQRRPQSLRVCNVTSLGEKRFVAIVQYGRRRFLVGGGAGAVSLLAKLDRDDSSAELLPAAREVRSNLPPLPLIPAAAADASPFNLAMKESSVGTRLAI